MRRAHHAQMADIVACLVEGPYVSKVPKREREVSKTEGNTENDEGVSTTAAERSVDVHE